MVKGEAAAQGSKAVSELARAIMHDVTNQVGVVKLSGGLLRSGQDRLKKTDPESAATLATSLKFLEKASARIEVLLGHLRQVVRLPEGDMVAVDLREAVEEAVTMAKSGMVQGTVVLACDAPDTPCIVAGRVEHIQRMFANLLGDVCVTLSTGGESILSVRITRDRDEQGAEVWVCDLRTPTPVDSAASSQNDDGGLGLDIARCIAQLHGGSVEANPEGKAGVRFRVCLPVAEAC